MKEIKYIDLFCGLGAFHTTFNNISDNDYKYKCVFSSDIDENIQKIYYENYGMKPFGDINNVNINEIPDFDILCAGFPCQPFSIAGKKKGFSDEIKGNLFFTILKIIDIKNPNIVILENVKNLLKIDNSNTFTIIINELKKRKYMISYKVLDSKKYGSPQSRQRLFIICNKKKEYIFKNKSINHVKVKSIIDFNETKYLDYKQKYYLEKCTNENDDENDDEIGSNNEENNTNNNNNNNNNKSILLYKLININTNKGGRQGERVYSIESSGITICASSGGPGAKTGLYYINNNVRRLNVNETLKMFGFTEDYKWKNIVKDEQMLFYLGNSIVVNVLNELLKNIQDYL
jgi:DNA (cytosine-5)-methyltransferase 1